MKKVKSIGAGAYNALAAMFFVHGASARTGSAGLKRFAPLALFLAGIVLPGRIASGQVFVKDTFTGTNGTALASHTPDTGGTWAPNSSSATISIQSNEAGLTGTANPALYVNSATPPSANYVVEVTGYWPAGANNTSYAVGLLARASSDNLPTAGDPNRYQAYLDGSGAVTLQYHSGSNTTIATGSISAPPSTAFFHVIALVVNGSTISVYIDGVSVVSGTDTHLTAAGYAGIRMASPSGVSTLMADNFLAASNLQLAITSVSPASPTVGVGFSVTVQAQVNGSAFNVVNATNVSLSRYTGTGTLGGTLTGTIAAGSNSVTISGVTYTKAESGVALTATETSGDTMSPGNSAPFTVQVGAAALLVFTTPPSGSGTSGIAWGTQPKVTVEDVGGNTVAGYSTGVTLGIYSGTGTLTCTTNPVTPTLGVATFAGCSLDKATTYTLMASSGTITNSTTNPSIAISAGGAAKLAFTTQPGGGTGGTAWSQQPVVTVQDANGNTVTTDTSTVTVAIQNNAGGGTLSGTLTKAAVAGVANFSANGLKIDKIGTGYTLTATDGSLTSATSQGFNITVGAAAQLAFTTQPGGGTGGTAWAQQPVVTVQDAGGNTVTTDTSTVTVAIANNAGPGGVLSGTLTKAAVAGVASFSANGLKIDKIGTGYTLSATDGSLSSATSQAFNITVGAAAKLGYSAVPGTGTAGTPFSVTVQSQDAGGNAASPTTNTTITLSKASGGGTLSGTLTGTILTSGNSVTISTPVYSMADTMTLTATATAGETSLTAVTSGSIVFSAGAPAQLVFTTQPGGGTGGTAWSQQPAVTVQDANGNTVTTDTSTVTVAIQNNAGPGGTLSGTLTKAAVAGVANFSANGLKIDKIGTGYTLTATDGSLTSATSQGFNITLGPAAKLAFTTQPSGGTAGTAWTTQPAVTVQDAGGNTVTTDTSTVTVAIGTNPGGGTLSGTLTEAAVAGVANFSGNGLNINKIGTGYTLSATDGSLTGATSQGFNITAGVAAQLAFTTQPGGGAAGAAWAQQPAVTLQDALGNTVTGTAQNVTLAIQNNAGPGGVLGGTATVAVNTTTGVATFSGLSIDKAGIGYTLTATGNTVNTTPGTVVSSAFDITTAGCSKTYVSGSTWSSATWNPSGAPGSGDDVCINVTGSIAISTSTSIKSLTISGSAGTITQGSGSSVTLSGSFTQSAGTYYVGYNDGTTTGGGSLAVGGFNQSGGTFTVMDTVPPASASGTASMTVNGNLALSGAGVFNVALDSSTTSGRTAVGTVTVTGNVTISAGTLNLTNGSTAGAPSGTLNVAGNFSQAGGTLARAGSTVSGIGVVVFNGTSQIYTGGGTVTSAVSYTVNSGATVVLTGNGSLGSSTGTFTVSSGGTLDATSMALTGTGALFTLASGGTLKIGNANGITSSGATGSIQTTGTRTFSTGANYVYDGGTVQSPGAGLPATVNNLTVSGSGTYLKLTNSVTVTKTLTVDTGQFDQNACSGTLTLTLTVGQMALTNGGNYIYCNSSGTGVTITSTLTFNGSAPELSVGSGSTFDYVGASPITFTGALANVLNSGVIRINGGGYDLYGGPDCGGGSGTLSITSTATNTWSGSGRFLLADLDLTNQRFNPISPGVAVYGRCTGCGGTGGNGFTVTNCGPTPPTLVSFRSFSAIPQDGGVLLQWQSGREVANLGFHIYRDGSRITSSPVAGSALLAGPATVLTAGNSYSWFDSQGTAASKYDIEDLDLNGARTKHGPFLVDAVPASRAGFRARAAVAGRVSPLLSQVGRAGAGSDLAFTVTVPEPEAPAVAASEASGPNALGGRRPGHAPAAPRAAASAINQQYALAGGQAVKLGVRQEGWYHVDASQLTAAGMPAGVDPQSLQLFAEGREQAMVVQGTGQVSGIEFYGTGLDTTFSDTRVYWLAWGSRQGKRVEPDNGQGRGTAPASFTAAVQWRPRTVYFAALVNGDADNFFGPTLDSSDPVTQPLTIANLNAATTGSSTLRVTMQGVTAGAHAVVVRLNGSELGTMRFNGQDNSSSAFTVPNSLLQEGANTLALATYGPGDVSAVDTVLLSYPHSYTAKGDYLRFTAPAGSPVTVGGFSSQQIQVVDITNPADVVSLQGTIAAQGTGFAVTIAPMSRGTRTLLAFTTAQESQPASITAHHPSSWHAPQPGADMVIVSHADFLSSLGPLVSLRQAQDHTVAAIDVQDLYDEFNFGEQSPYAIKTFLATASKVWNTKPHWVLLVGDATFDPRNYLGTGRVDYLPVELVGTSQLETASDDWYVDLNDDGNPRMAIGRLPADSAAGAAALVSKIVAYETAGAAPWKNRALLVSGANDSDNTFEGYTAAVQALLPASMTVTKILQGSDANAAIDLTAGFNSGQGLVNYIGHGSTEVWQGGLFSSAAAGGATNGSSTPLVVAMTCLNGYFQDVYTFSLAEALMNAPGGGAVAVWASSGLTGSAPQSTLDQSLIGALFGGASVTVGEAALAAKQTVGDLDVRRTWILFGDPAMRLR